MDKQLIAERFAKARSTYTREARVQQQVAGKMMRILTDVLYSAEHILPETLSARFRHIVEFGCGTGSYSRILLQTLQPDTLLLNDLCREMEECVGELCSTQAIPRKEGSTETEVRFLPGDAESLDFPEYLPVPPCNGSMIRKLSFSVATMHWQRTVSSPSALSGQRTCIKSAV